MARARSTPGRGLSAALALIGAFAVAKAMPTIEVDLDLPPEQRWIKAVKAFSHQLPALLSAYSQYAGSRKQLDQAAWVEHHNFGEEYLRELQGIVDAAAHPQVTLERLIIWNLPYEMRFPTFCSGFLVAQKNGTVVHGRNMDYTFLFQDGTRLFGLDDITFDADFRRGGQTLFTSVTWIGHIGIHTAMRPGGWSFEQNTRLGGTQEGNLAAAKAGGLAFAMAARRTMEEVSTFDEAVKRLANLHLMAPQYFVVAGAGPYQGAVMARQQLPDGNIQYLSEQNNKWFILQTNDDLSGRPKDLRRPFGEQVAHSLGQARMTPVSILRTMRTFPLFHPETVFTWIAVPQTGFHEAVLHSEPLGKTVLQPLE